MWDITCDRCSIEYLEVEADSFTEAVIEIRREGWSVYNDGIEWVHACGDCG